MKIQKHANKKLITTSRIRSKTESCKKIKYNILKPHYFLQRKKVPLR